jgi:hypothetical protein
MVSEEMCKKKTAIILFLLFILINFKWSDFLNREGTIYYAEMLLIAEKKNYILMHYRQNIL